MVTISRTMLTIVKLIFLIRNDLKSVVYEITTNAAVNVSCIAKME